MQNRSGKPQRPRDPNQRAHQIFLESIGEAEPPPVMHENTERPKNQAAVELGRLGGLKGGKARMAALSAAERSEIGKKAAAARWGKKDQ